jgi:LysM repeat protein
MAQERISQNVADRRCPNCGTRVARNAESCFMCGYDLRTKPQQQRRFSWIDGLLVLAVVAVLIFWWRVGTESAQQPEEEPGNAAILPTSIPLLEPTPTPTPTPTPAPTATPAELVEETVLVKHIVRAGETLGAIALQYDVTVEDIQAANSLDGFLIGIGDELTIPIVRTNTSGSNASGPQQDFLYTVESGDTLIGIALKFGSTTDSILQANGLATNALIIPGDQLIVPVANVPPEALTIEVPAAGAAATPRPGRVYAQPQLVNPPDGASLARSEPVLLQWVSVDLLQPNEWYVLQLFPRTLDSNQIPTAWTKQTSFRLETGLAPVEGTVAEYSWQISVVRVNRAETGELVLEAASPASEVRTFSWR